jgi:hypothetical protein
MRRLYFVLILLVLGLAACISGSRVLKEATPTPLPALNLLVTTTPRAPITAPSQPAGIETLDPITTPDCSPDRNSPDAQLVYPVLQMVEPAPAEPGQSIRLVASGGYLTWQDACGRGYDESYRTFTWSLDEEYQGEIGCYVNHCEIEFKLPEDIHPGVHTIEVEGGSQITLEVSAPYTHPGDHRD